jgi:hypothetical protein
MAVRPASHPRGGQPAGDQRDRRLAEGPTCSCGGCGQPQLPGRRRSTRLFQPLSHPDPVQHRRRRQAREHRLFLDTPATSPRRRSPTARGHSAPPPDLPLPTHARRRKPRTSTCIQLVMCTSGAWCRPSFGLCACDSSIGSESAPQAGSGAAGSTGGQGGADERSTDRRSRKLIRRSLAALSAQLRTYIAVQRRPPWTPVVGWVGDQLGGPPRGH